MQAGGQAARAQGRRLHAGDRLAVLVPRREPPLPRVVWSMGRGLVVVSRVVPHRPELAAGGAHAPNVGAQQGAPFFTAPGGQRVRV